MYVVYNKENQKKPIKIWLENEKAIEDGCLEQALNLSNLPFIHKWIALMPDTHMGYGMPIGGVIATENVVIPNAVGVDIGCGMGFIQTNIPVKLIKEINTPSNGKLINAIIGCILREIPTGFSHHKEQQQSLVLDKAIASMEELSYANELIDEIEKGYYQIGTLGGGNHFIELQEDDNGMLGIMLHSGSRNFGYKVCKYFNDKAKELNKQWYSSVSEEFDLAFLPTNTIEGQSYIKWMNLALDFAKENRQHMLNKVSSIVFNMTKKYTDFTNIETSYEINCHHNYATLENHYGKNVWVHRKGAICAREGVQGIIPSAMGDYSYIVEGLGNKESFNSCSHGAGRRMGRKQAMKEFTFEEVKKDLADNEVILGKLSMKDVAEECRMAYKDINTVLANEVDLVKPIKRLKTIGVVKG